jgi:hypothetical protein
VKSLGRPASGRDALESWRLRGDLLAARVLWRLADHQQSSGRASSAAKLRDLALAHYDLADPNPDPEPRAVAMPVPHGLPFTDVVSRTTSQG